MLAKATTLAKVAVATPAIKVIRVAAGRWAERPATATISPASAAEPIAAAAAAAKKMSLARTSPLTFPHRGPTPGAPG
jgi:hypothetical protein